MADVPPPEQPGWYADADGTWWWWDGWSWTPAPAAVPAGVGPGPDRRQERTTALVMWIVVLVGGSWVAALIFYVTAREKPFVRHHAAEALNLSILTVPLSLLAVGAMVPDYVDYVVDLLDDPAATPHFGPLFYGGLAASVVVGLVSTGLAIAGLAQAAKGRWWRLPLPFHPVRGAVAPGEQPYSVE